MQSKSSRYAYKALLLISGLLAGSLHAQNNTAELPQYADEQHIGVATCANSMCHGVRVMTEPSNVRQNEYHTWLFNDRHAQAYKTLLSDESKKIAQKLGLESAATAAICLDCHADNVPKNKQGPEFHITDGVGCEACHGGAEKYIATHTIKPYSQERNINDGMYPTGPLASRTLLCTSCHVGTSKKLANHNIMGAGHPRLSFELDTFIARQPEHFDVDDDYVKRKGHNQNSAETAISRMMVGAALSATANAQNLTGSLLDHPQGFPEVALFNCHSCHKSLNNATWQNRPSTAGLKPGTVRLNDGSFILLAAITGAFDQRLQTSLVNAIKQLHKASLDSTDSVKEAAKRIIQLSSEAQVTFDRVEITKPTSDLILKELVEFGANGEYNDYIAAEQALMAMSAISEHYPGNIQLENFINEAYSLTGNDEKYQPTAFRLLMSRYMNSL